MGDNLSPYDELVKRILAQLQSKKLVKVRLGVSQLQRAKTYTLYEFEDGSILLVPAIKQ